MTLTKQRFHRTSNEVLSLSGQVQTTILCGALKETSFLLHNFPIVFLEKIILLFWFKRPLVAISCRTNWNSNINMNGKSPWNVSHYPTKLITYSCNNYNDCTMSVILLRHELPVQNKLFLSKRKSSRYNSNANLITVDGKVWWLPDTARKLLASCGFNCL